MFEIQKYHEEFEDTKEVISSSKSKNDRQYNGTRTQEQTAMYKDLHIKLKIV